MLIIGEYSLGIDSIPTLAAKYNISENVIFNWITKCYIHINKVTGSASR